MQTPPVEDHRSIDENQSLVVPKLEMPACLAVVRHGESEANLVQRAVKEGVLSEYPQGFSSIPDREFRLSKLGCQQAEKTGLWLKEQYPGGFDVIFVSDHVRAKETAALVCRSAGWEDVTILVDPMVGERHWGRFSEAEAQVRDRIMGERRRDPLHAAMPDGETLLSTRHRSRILLERVSREFAGAHVLAFSHGEYIEALWAEIEHMSTERQREFFHSEAGDIRNCQIVEFSSVDPVSNENDGKLRWVRSSCPQAQVFRDWNRMAPKKFTPTELLEQVYRYPNLDFGDMKD